MSNDHGPQGSGHGEYALRVWRVAAGDRFTVRLLSEELRGLFTHYTRHGSEYCAGCDCPPALHRTARFWKGYAAVEIWLPAEKSWLPAVLEVTENLELDFRGKWRRCQLWELYRARQTTKRKTPVGAVLVADSSLDPVLEPFDITDTLLRLYHVEQLALDQCNPLPPRTIVKPRPGAAPPAPAKGTSAADKPASAETVKRFREMMQQHRERETN